MDKEKKPQSLSNYFAGINLYYGIVAVALVLCIAPMPYGYYMLVRIAIIIAFAIMAINYAKVKKSNMCIACIAVIMIFQPFFKIPFGRVLWNIIDIATAIFLLYCIWTNRKQIKE